MKIKEFINETLIKEIYDIQQEHTYLSFSLITQGIEFLGYFLDDKDIFQEGKSRSRFDNAIYQLFPDEYKKFINNKKNPYSLYDKLRCGLNHVIVPQSGIELIQVKEIPDYGKHLEIKTIRGAESLVLVAENFYNDFKNACNKIIDRIDKGDIENNKILATNP